jgi:hypothetical protein
MHQIINVFKFGINVCFSDLNYIINKQFNGFFKEILPDS